MEAKYIDIVAISGKSGLYRADAHKTNGVIATSLETGETSFVSNRNHMFSMLDSITVYTDKEGVDLWQALEEMKKQAAENPPVAPNSSGKELRGYFDSILPSHDHEKVYTSDIKKILKWYAILDDKGIIEKEIENRKKQEEEQSKTDESSKTENAEETGESSTGE